MLQNATFFPLPHGSQNQIKRSLTEILFVMKNEGENWRKLVYRKKNNVVGRATFQDPTS